MSDTTSSYQTRTTPGVYITEIDTFGPGIVGVATAVPIFVGYTQFAGDPGGRTLYGKPVFISSMAEYLQYFGGPALQRYDVVLSPAVATGDFTADYTRDAGVVTADFNLVPAPTGGPDQFNLYWQMLLLFTNGGGDCYVVSAGSYWASQLPTAALAPVPATWLPGSIEAGDLLAFIAAEQKREAKLIIQKPQGPQKQGRE